jgi:hypothetical protein
MNFSREMARQYTVRCERRLRRHLRVWQHHETVLRGVGF